MKKLLAILFAAVLCLALGVTAWADEPANYIIVLEKGGVYKNAVAQGNELTNTGITGSGDATNGYTYTFNNVDFETTAIEAILVHDAKANIVLEGQNTVEGGQYGIFFSSTAEGDLATISGNGTLNATGGTDKDGSYGIYVNASLSISGAANVTATGAASTNISYGIYALSSIDLSGLTTGKVIAQSLKSSGKAVNKNAMTPNVGWEYKADASATTYANGIGKTISNDLQDKAYLEIKTTTVPNYTIILSGGNAYKYTADEKNKITSAELATFNISATAGSTTYTFNGVNFETTDAYAIEIKDTSATIILKGTNNIKSLHNGDNSYSDGIEGKDLTFSGDGTLNVTGGKAKTRSTGIAGEGGTITVSDKVTINATGGQATEADSRSYGIWSYNGIAVSNTAKVTAIGGAATNSYGIYTYNNSITISNNAIVTATGGTATNNNYGIGSTSVYISENAQVTATGDKGGISVYKIDISGLTGGKLITKATSASGKATDASVAQFPTNWKYKTSADATEYTTGTTLTDTLKYGSYLEIVQGSVTVATTYTVSFDANSGTGTMADVTGVSGEYTLPACGFTAPEGKEFAGWATSKDGEVVSGTTITVNGNVTLYAQWKVKETTPTPTPDPKPEAKPTPCDHKLDANGKCSRCGVVIITYPRDDAEANPNTGAPVFAPAAIIVLAAAAILGKRK